MDATHGWNGQNGKLIEVFKAFEDFNVDRSKTTKGWRQANEDDIRSFLGMPPKNSNIVEANIIPWAERPLPSFGRSLKAAQAAMRKSRDEFKAAAKTRRAAFMAFIGQRRNQLSWLKVKQRRLFMAHLNSIRQTNEKHLKLSYTTYMQRLAKASRLLRHDDIMYKQHPSPFGDLPPATRNRPPTAQRSKRQLLKALGSDNGVPSVPGLSSSGKARRKHGVEGWWRRRPQTAPPPLNSAPPPRLDHSPADILSRKAQDIQLSTAAAWSPNVIKPQADGQRLMLDVSHYGMPREKVGPTIQRRIEHHKRSSPKPSKGKGEEQPRSSRINRLCLTGNRVGWEGALQVLRDLPQGVQHVDLSLNGIGNRVPVSARLTQLLSDAYDREGGCAFKRGYKAWSNGAQLLSLDLAGNLVGMRGGVQILLAALKRCPQLASLNLSKNHIDQSQLGVVADILSTVTSLRALNLSWNSVKDASPLQLASAPNLEDLDLSWNALGKDVEKFAVSLARNKRLQHVNLANNAFAVKAVQVLAEQLKQNHTLLGLHFDGAHNKGYVDPKGFLIPLATDKAHKETVHTQPRCWVCGGWKEHKFFFREKGSLKALPTKADADAELERKFQLDGKAEMTEDSSSVVNPVITVYLRLEIDNWAPRKMVLRQMESGEIMHVLHRVLPPSVPIHYCFASPGKPHIVALDHGNTVITAHIPPAFEPEKPAPKAKRRRSKSKNRRRRSRPRRRSQAKTAQATASAAAKAKAQAEAEAKKVVPKPVSVNVTVIKPVVPFSKRTHIGRTRPRALMNAAELNSSSGVVFKERQSVYWDLKDLALGFKQDCEQLFSKESFVKALDRYHPTKQSLTALKQRLWQYYPNLCKVHRYYSSLSPNPSYFVFAKHEFHIFLQDAELPEDANVDLLFLVSRSTSQFITGSVPQPDTSGRRRSNTDMQASSVGRGSFFEVLVRLAIMLYGLGHGEAVGPNTLLRGLTKLLERINSKMTYQVQHDINTFRKAIVYLEDTEEALVKFVPVLKWLFVVYSDHPAFAHILHAPASPKGKKPSSPRAPDESEELNRRQRRKKKKNSRKPTLDVDKMVQATHMGFEGFRELLVDAGMLGANGSALLPGFVEQQAALAMARSMPFLTTAEEPGTDAFAMGFFDMLEVLVRLSTLIFFRAGERESRTNAEFEGHMTVHMDERVDTLIAAMLRMPRVSRKLWACIPADVRVKQRFDTMLDIKAATGTKPFPSVNSLHRTEPTIRKFLVFYDNI